MDYFYTQRLKLRRLTEADIPLMVAWSRTPEAYGEHLSMECLSTEDCVVKLATSYWNDSGKTYIMELKTDGKPIGTIHYWRKPDDPFTGMLALKVAEPAYRGQGYGTEAQKGLIREMFLKVHLRAIDIITAIDNIPEQRCLEKLNFNFVDILTYQDQGVERQGRLYRMTRHEYDQSSVYMFDYA